MLNRLEQALRVADVDALRVLCSIIGCTQSLSTRLPLLTERLEWYLNARCAVGDQHQLYSYARLCTRAGKSLHLRISADPIENELRIVEHFANRLDESLGNEARKSVSEVLAQYEQDGRQNLVKLFSAGGLIALIKAGGFGSYISASTVLGAATSALNVSLPFSVYIGMSQALSSILGPAAWVALGVGAFQSIRRNSDRQFVPLVIWTYTVHARKEMSILS